MLSLNPTTEEIFAISKESNIVEFPKADVRQSMKLQKAFEENHKLLETYAAEYKIQISPEERAKRTQQKLIDPATDEIKTVTWAQLVGYLLDNCHEFSSITFNAPNDELTGATFRASDTLATLDSTINTGGELTNGILASRIRNYIAAIDKILVGNRVTVTVCHNGQNIGFLKGENDEVFGVTSA